MQILAASVSALVMLALAKIAYNTYRDGDDRWQDLTGLAIVAGIIASYLVVREHWFYSLRPLWLAGLRHLGLPW